MNRAAATETIVRIVEDTTTPMRPETAARHTILLPATRDRLSLTEAFDALGDPLSNVLLVEEGGRIRVASAGS